MRITSPGGLSGGICLAGTGCSTLSNSHVSSTTSHFCTHHSDASSSAGSVLQGEALIGALSHGGSRAASKCESSTVITSSSSAADRSQSCCGGRDSADLVHEQELAIDRHQAEQIAIRAPLRPSKPSRQRAHLESGTEQWKRTLEHSGVALHCPNADFIDKAEKGYTHGQSIFADRTGKCMADHYKSLQRIELSQADWFSTGIQPRTSSILRHTSVVASMQKRAPVSKPTKMVSCSALVTRLTMEQPVLGAP